MNDNEALRHIESVRDLALARRGQQPVGSRLDDAHLADRQVRYGLTEIALQNPDARPGGPSRLGWAPASGPVAAAALGGRRCCRGCLFAASTRAAADHAPSLSSAFSFLG
jgi:hypothetical protein